MNVSYRGKPTHKVLDKYLNGDCHSFALALREITGWDLVAFYDRGNVEWSPWELMTVPISTAVPHHIAVVGPAGLVDVSGIVRNAHWLGFSIEPIAEETVRRLKFCNCKRKRCGTPNVGGARAVANFVYMQLQKNPVWFCKYRSFRSEEEL